MNITSFNARNLDILRVDMQRALDEVGAKYGIKLPIGRISYNDGSFRAPIEAKCEAGDARAESLFDEMCKLSKLDKTREVTTRQGLVRLVGFNTRKRTKPWMLTINGKEGYIADDNYVRQHFRIVDAGIGTVRPA